MITRSIDPSNRRDPKLMHSTSAAAGPTEIQADGWLTHPRSKWYEVVEDSVLFENEALRTLR